MSRPLRIEYEDVYYHVTRTEITKGTRGRYSRNIPRSIAMKLCQIHSGPTLPVIAKHFNVKHYSAVSVTIARLNRLLEADKVIASKFSSISQDLPPQFLKISLYLEYCKMNSDLKTLSLIRVQVLIFASFMLLASFLLFWVYVKFSEGGFAFSLAMGIVFFPLFVIFGLGGWCRQ